MVDTISGRSAMLQNPAKEELPWKVPIWQAKTVLAPHPNGPLTIAYKEGYMQKRAGKSRFRWNIRYFELKEGKLKWWRPNFTEQIRLKPGPKCMGAAAKGHSRPVRCLDLTKLKSVTRTKCKFPYSTRILLRFSDTEYELELRAEVELVIIEWYRLFSRFTMETYEVEAVEDEDVTEVGTTQDGESDDSSEWEEVQEATSSTARPRITF